MASREAHDAFIGEMPDWRTAEGISMEIPYREDECEIVADVIGGLRSGLTYAGASNVRELQRKLSYMFITSAAYFEGLGETDRG